MIDWAKSRLGLGNLPPKNLRNPFPYGTAKNAEKSILAEPDWAPIDPRTEDPKIKKMPKMRLQNIHARNRRPRHMVRLLNHMRRTRRLARQPKLAQTIPRRPPHLRLRHHPHWAYYLMVRHLALFDEKPYKSVLINGMVLGSDGRKMSKSLGNYVATPDVFNKYGADAPRQWAASGGATGSDIPFRWADVEYGWRFLIKLWNAARFASLHLRDYTPQVNVELDQLDRWLLTKMEKVTQRATTALENCQFNIATEEIRNFTWHELCDQYIEAIKHRLYKPETYGKKRKKPSNTVSTRRFTEPFSFSHPFLPT